MKRTIWDSWGVAIVAGLLTGIPLTVASIYVGAWVTGAPIKHPMDVTWLVTELHLNVPVWLVFPGIGLAALLAALYIWQRTQTHVQREAAIEAHSRLQEAQARHDAELADLRSHGPKLHGIWNSAQTFWHMGRKGMDPAMQIGGWIDLTPANTTEMVYLLAAYICGKRADIFMDVALKPGRVNRVMVMLFMVPPLKSDATKPFTATIVVEDQYNRKYELPSHEFRATPGQVPVPVPAVGTGSRLHVSWLGSAAWGWATPSFVDEPLRVYTIRGEATFLMDCIEEPVHITGVEIDGAESKGVFEEFDLHPGKIEKRDLRLFFQGPAPEGNDYYSPELVFRDIKGNRYLTAAHRFQPLPIPERIANERGIAPLSPT